MHSGYPETAWLCLSDLAGMLEFFGRDWSVTPSFSRSSDIRVVPHISDTRDKKIPPFRFSHGNTDWIVLHYKIQKAFLNTLPK